MDEMKLHSITFHEDSLDVVTVDKEGQRDIYISPRKVCENIGLAWSSQRRKINEHHRFSQGTLIIETTSNGGSQKTLCLQKRKFLMWLYSINPEKASGKFRPKLEKYQDDVERVIDQCFGSNMPNLASSRVKSEEGDVLAMISSQARLIAALADEMYGNRKRIEKLENEFQEIRGNLLETTVAEKSLPYEVEFETNEILSVSTESHISSGQAQILRTLAKEKTKNGGSVMKLWAKFKVQFDIERYVHLPKNRFDEAVKWIENL